MTQPQYLLATLHLPDKKRRNFHTFHDGYTPLSVTITSILPVKHPENSYTFVADCKSALTNSSHQGLCGEIDTRNTPAPVVDSFVAEYRKHLAHGDVTRLEMQVWAAYQPEYQRIRFAIPLPGFSQTKSRPPLKELEAYP